MGSDLFLLFLWKDINDPVNSSGGAGRVQGAEDQVAGLRRHDGGFNRFQITHFTDQDHVRIHSQSFGDRFREGTDIRM